MKHSFLLSYFLCAGTLLPAQLIFPGDLNNDGTANYLDLLPLGVAYGQEGPPRPEATTEWSAQENFPWPAFLPVSGVNLGFVDADGNGFIDSLDIEAITLNYDSVQAAAIPPPMPYLLPETLFVTELPQLILRFEPEIAAPGEQVRLILDYIVPDPSVFLPEEVPLAIAFVLEFADSLIDEALTVIEPNTASPDLMFVAATANSAQFWRSPPPGQIEFAAAGKGVPALAQSQILAEMLIVIEDMILLSQPLDPMIKAPLLINGKEQVIALKTEVKPLQINRMRSAQAGIVDAQAFPNPASGLLQVELASPAEAQLGLFSPAGQCLRRIAFSQGSSFSIDVSQLPPGLYFLRIDTAQGQVVKKVLVGR
jgi:hypothetical protein